jgi:hypothetical protein
MSQRISVTMGCTNRGVNKPNSRFKGISRLYHSDTRSYFSLFCKAFLYFVLQDLSLLCFARPFFSLSLGLVALHLFTENVVWYTTAFFL